MKIAQYGILRMHTNTVSVTVLDRQVADGKNLCMTELDIDDFCST